MILLGKHIILVLLLLVSQTISASDLKLQLEIELSKDTYLLREPIWLDITLTNVSEDTVRTFGLFPPCQGLFSVELKDAQGENMPYTGLIYEMTQDTGRLTYPKGMLYDCYDLLELFSTYKSLLRTRYGMLPLGKYSVRARYGDIYSRTIIFEVIETTENEKEAYQLLNDAYAFWPRKEFDLARQKYQDVIDQFPKSVYAEKAFRELPQRCELILSFPNSGYNKMFLSESIEKLSLDKQQEFLQNIIKGYSNTRIAKFAEQMLRMHKKESSNCGSKE